MIHSIYNRLLYIFPVIVFLLGMFIFTSPVFAVNPSVSVKSTTSSKSITVAFPAERQQLAAITNSYVIGAVSPKRTEPVIVGSVTASVYRTGAFIAMIPVKSGNNEIVISQGNDRLVRHFTVATPNRVSPVRSGSKNKLSETAQRLENSRTSQTVGKLFEKPIVSELDSRLEKPRAWQTIGNLFENRVRTMVDDGDSIYYLPKGFLLRGQAIKGYTWVAVCLNNHLYFMPKNRLKLLNASTPLPAKDLVPPDITAGFPSAPPYHKRLQDICIYVDAGHGGIDSGALSPHGWCEKDVNLMQAKAIKLELEKTGFRVLMSREGDTFPELMARPLQAYQARVDAVISVHHNATAAQSDPRRARHTTTYASTSNGMALAESIQRHIAPVVKGVTNHGAQYKSLAVCRNPAIPSCLLEVDFINLPEGEAESWDPVRQKRVAEAVVCGVLDWMTPPIVEIPTEETPLEILLSNLSATNSLTHLQTTNTTTLLENSSPTNIISSGALTNTTSLLAKSSPTNIISSGILTNTTSLLANSSPTNVISSGVLTNNTQIILTPSTPTNTEISVKGTSENATTEQSTTSWYDYLWHWLCPKYW